jgi:nucleoside-diphosphate-sugar epimerase
MKCDLIFFGFGGLTSKLILDSLKNDKKVICVSEHVKSHHEKFIDNNRANVRFLTKQEVISKEINCENAIVSWRDNSNLEWNKSILKAWIESTSFTLNRILHLSSASVYTDYKRAVSEDSFILDLNQQGSHKFELEKDLKKIADRKFVQITQLRVSNIYGPSMNSSFIKRIQDAVQKERKLDVFENREIYRDFIHEDDVLLAIRSLMEIDDLPEIINISTGQGTSISAILEIVKSHFVDLKLNEIKVGKNVKLSSILDCSLLASLIEWNPRKLSAELENLLSVK